MKNALVDSWYSGPHFLEFESPDIFHCHIHGRVEEEHARKAVRIAADELCARRGLRLFFVVHLSAAADATFEPGARKFLVTTMYDWKGIIIVGGSPLMRMTATVLARAHSMLKTTSMPTVFVKSMDEARKHIDEIRAKEAASGRFTASTPP